MICWPPFHYGTALCLADAMRRITLLHSTPLSRRLTLLRHALPSPRFAVPNHAVTMHCYA